MSLIESVQCGIQHKNNFEMGAQFRPCTQLNLPKVLYFGQAVKLCFYDNRLTVSLILYLFRTRKTMSQQLVISKELCQIASEERLVIFAAIRLECVRDSKTRTLSPIAETRNHSFHNAYHTVFSAFHYRLDLSFRLSDYRQFEVPIRDSRQLS